MRIRLRPLALSVNGKPSDPKAQRDLWLIIGAFAAVYIAWGATYLFNYFAIQAIPPFLMSGGRFLAAGSALYIFLLLRKTPAPTLRQWMWSILLGILFLALGTGGMVWALQYIDTGFAALLVAIDPLVIMLLLWLIQGVRPGRGGLFGAILGMIGMYLLLGQPQMTAHPKAWLGLIAVSVSLLAWAFASIFVSKLDLPANRIQRSAMQMLGGGVVLVVFSVLSGEAQRFSLAAVDWKAGLSWLYLVAFGSILAFSCFNYLLSKVSPEKVATSTYVNPLVALVLGWAFNNETITNTALVAGGLMLTGVYFINAVKH